MPRISDLRGPSGDGEACAQCRHAWDDHVLHPRVYPYPTDGWMTCPHPACGCRKTWGVETEVRGVFDALRADLFRKVADGGPLPDGVGMDLWYYRLRDAQWSDQVNSATDVSWLREFDALYLFGTIGTEAVLRGNGQVWVRPDEQWDDPTASTPDWRPATDRERTAALVIASWRMQEVRSLLPNRPEGAADCGRCSGSGCLVSDVVCHECDGLGWISPPAT